LEKLAYTYALIKSCHEHEKDYVDAFCPLVLKVLQQSGECTDSSIQKGLINDFDLKIPLHTLRTVLQRLVRKKYALKKKEERYELTTLGLEHLGTFTDEGTVKRRLTELLDDLMQFLNNELNESLNIDQTQKKLLTFVHKNIEPVLYFFVPHGTSREFQNDITKRFESKIDREDERCLIKYIQIAKERKPLQYSVLQELILGSLISLVFSFDIPSLIKDKEFAHCQIFLDTNILFSLVGVHFKEFSEPAKELLNLLKKYCFKVKVFDFTVDEATRVLNKCRKERREYPQDMKVNSICANLKKQKWTKQDIEIFVANIETKISELDVEIEPTDIDVQNYTPHEDNARDAMEKYKPSQPLVSQNHDIAAIEKIEEIRKHHIRRIEDSNALFLTSDGKLSEYNFIERGHRENGTICEVVLDRFLTSVLWLKHPEVELSLETLIATCYRDVFINVRIWEKFYDSVQELKQKKVISEKDISSLLWQESIEDVLCNLDEQDADKITQEFVLAKTKEAKEVTQIIDKKRKKTEERLEKQQQEIETQQQEVNALKHEIDTLSQERVDNDKKTKEAEERLEKQHQEVNALKQKIDALSQERADKEEIQREYIKNNTEKLAKKRSYLISSVITAIIILLVIPVIYEIFLVSETYGFKEVAFVLIPSVICTSSIYAIWKKLRIFLTDKISNQYYKKKIEEMGLHEREMNE
jgi:hypothetical protein